jgi:hypothetical protein
VLLMMQEAVPVLTFGNHRRGKPIQVDIHDPTVRGLIKAGYLKIRWKELPHGADSLDSAGVDGVPTDHLGSGVAGEPQAEEDVDGAGEDQPGEEDRPRAQGDAALHRADL